MAGTAGQRSTEHDEADRTAFAVMLVILGLVGSMIALAHRQTITHASAAGDACPTKAHGGLVGLDAQTGAVRWSNVVPDGGSLRLDEETGRIHHVRPAFVDGEPDTAVVVDRVVDPATGRISACTSERSQLSVAPYNNLVGDVDPVDPPLTDADVTVQRWGAGIRATDATNTGIWSIDAGRAEYRVGGELIVVEDGRDDTDRPTRTARIDLRTGEQRWVVDGTLTNRGAGAATLVTRSWTRPDDLSGVDPDTGDVRWTTKVRFDGDTAADGVVDTFDVGSLVIVPTGADGRVAALDARTGELRWTATAGTPGRNRRFSRPGEADGAVLSADGKTVVVSVDTWMPEASD
ncbi:MAG: PQQ-like domain [Ilumatobacteraceae bacterium]|nr:PQQ-like domain [Ilumatobacteraceae bacterium]